MMKIGIRQEITENYPAIYKLTELAFRDLEISEHNEKELVEGGCGLLIGGFEDWLIGGLVDWEIG